MVFIPKSSRCVYTCPKDSRLISVTSFLLKIVERPVDKYIKYLLDHEYSLHVNQHAYGVDLSTETALHWPLSTIREQLDANKSICHESTHGHKRGVQRHFEGILKVRTLNRQTASSLIKSLDNILTHQVLEANKDNITTRGIIDFGCTNGAGLFHFRTGDFSLRMV